MIALQRFALLAVCFLIAGCRAEVPSAQIEGADVTVVVTDLGTGAWQIDYTYTVPQSALIFGRSNGDYRSATWTPLAGAPDIQRIGGFDALIFDTPVTEFSFEIIPHTRGIPQDYTPFLAFSDGGTAMYTGQFELLAVADRAEIESLEGNLRNWTGEQPALGVRVKSERPMLLQGEQANGSVEHVSVGSGTYVYIGETELHEGRSYIGVIDEALPQHIRDNLDNDLEALFAFYEKRWGFALPTRGSIYFAFEGYDRPGFSNKGSVIGTDLMVLQASGEGLRDPDPANRARNLWFFAHEGAHMFQSKVMGQFAVGPDAWIHEGGANTMANSALANLPSVTASFIMEEYQNAFESCIQDLERGSLLTAHLDGRFYAHYHCGQLFNAAADAALTDHDLYAFWSAFANKLDPDRPEPAEAFFETLDELGADPRISDSIRALAYEDSIDPRKDLSRLLSLSGLEPTFDENGALVSLKVPE
jgi:hypothetical protein